METDSQTTPLATQAPERKIKVSYIVFTLLAVLVTVGSFFAGYEVGKNQQVAPQKQVETTKNNKITNWKTYTNTELGFSIQHLENWFVEEQGTQENRSIRFQNYNPASAEGRGYDPIADMGKWGFVINKGNFPSRPKDISQLKLEIQQPNSDCGYMGDPAGKLVVTNEKEILVGDYPTYSREEKCSELPDSSKSETTYILDKNGEVLGINKIMDYEKEYELFNYIISTLKFIDQVPNTTSEQEPVNNWTDYKNTNLKISFKHPSGWTIRGYAGDQENYQNNENTYTRFVLSSPDDSISAGVTNQLFEGSMDQCMASEEVKEKNVDGVQYKMETYASECEKDVNDLKITTLISSEKKFNMSFNYSRSNSTTAEPVIDQIVSTIRFIK